MNIHEAPLARARVGKISAGYTHPIGPQDEAKDALKIYKNTLVKKVQA